MTKAPEEGFDLVPGLLDAGGASRVCASGAGGTRTPGSAGFNRKLYRLSYRT